MSIRLSSKRSRLLLFIVVTNICSASPTCSSVTCKLSTENDTCRFKINHLSCCTVHQSVPIIEKLAYSCINEINCFECELRVPGTTFCGFYNFIQRAINK